MANWNTQQYISGRQRARTPYQGLTGTMSQQGVGVNTAGGLGLYGGGAQAYQAAMAQNPVAGATRDTRTPDIAPATPDVMVPTRTAPRYRPIAQTMADNNVPIGEPAAPPLQPPPTGPATPPAGGYTPAPYRTDPNDPNRGSYGQGGATVMPTITVAKPWAPQGFNTDNAADWARLQQPGSTTTNAQGQIVWAPQAVTKPYEVTSTASGIPRRQTVTPISSTAPFGVRR